MHAGAEQLMALRILHLLTLVDDDASYGGPVTVAIGQCRELNRQGHRAEILAGWREERTPPTELETVPAHLFRVQRALPSPRFTGLVSRGLVRWLHRHAEDFDVVHIHLARDLIPLVAARYLSMRGRPFVVQTHGMIIADPRRSITTLDRLLTVRALKAAAHRLVLTEIEADAVGAVAGPGAELTLLPNGVRLPEGLIAHEPDDPDVLFLARLHPRKRVMDFARASAVLIEDGSPARFSVVGPDDGDLPDLLAFIAARPALGGRLVYEGALPHQAALERIARCSIFVLCAVNEPFAMTMLEAMMMARPAICNDTSALAPALARSGSVLAVAPGVANLAAAIRGLLDDPVERGAMGARARDTVASTFSLGAVAARLESLYGPMAARFQESLR
jgi:glycosyltransferase involved in cell wall biosynthesis